MTDRPAASTSSAVPRSGCFMISPTGTASSTPATRKSSGRSCPSRFWNHQASISGMAIFRISLGWMMMPTLSQRRAPFLVMPKTATAISSTTPTVYSGTASGHQALRRHLRHDEHDEAGQQHVAAMVHEARAVVVAGGIHGQQSGAGQQEHGKRQRPVKAPEPGG